MMFDDAVLLFRATDGFIGVFDARDDGAAAAAAAALLFVVIDD